ncbi:NAD-dependent formate dehydrogenase [Cutaneotrichosporon oleaginosum]|uniref:Formate dehydrogenase n=1 Tax=Cutaneotrichosporon oleaginosum TaxID=879819 RepID=A0A0J0XMY7_9TREE|nr:NAD-dependent formate dehydrogenase [Cutaneotrichosporon oleaginosum]KLT42462.1 NAD-dependent formate dehydrogenase [Cutaneotrichosporon oleaginosum]TXT06981.1 hypothetical protein COLE_06312 [Cutaneotrichosporon oleaginosum]
MKVLIVLYSGGQAAQEQPRLLGTTENKLGIFDWLKGLGHDVVVTDDKEGPNSEFQKHIVDAEILVTTPFHPGYLTADLIDKAKNLKLCVTAGVGSDHVDLNAANKRKITVAEVSGSNVVSVAEHVVMTMLCLVRNFVPAHEQIINHKWNVAQIARDAYDLEGKVVGTIGCGRIGYRVLQRLEPFNCKELLWFDYNDIPAEAAKAISAKRVDTLDELLSRCDVITVNCPLHESTRGLINADAIKKMKKGVWIVNTARGAICDRKAIVEALESGYIAGYGGDVWDVQPAPPDHPWRDMRGPNGNGNAMTPHYSGTTLDAQARYAAGTKEIIENYLNGKPQNPANVIVENGEYATKAYGQRK